MRTAENQLAQATDNQFSVLRLRLDRPDLTDAELGEAFADAAGELGLDCTADDILGGTMEADAANRVVSAMCLPPPRAPLPMPVQDLRRTDRVGALSRVFWSIRRITG